MNRIYNLFFWVACPLTMSGISTAQVACHFGEGQAGQASLDKALTAAPSCRAADKILSQCAWGSSADVPLAAVVRTKCERAFLSKLTIEQRETYNKKLALCAYEFGGMDGTLYMSEGATCQSGIAVQYATNPKAQTEQVPTASFDCSKARSPIETTICNNPDLGRADIIMSRAYKPFLNALTAGEKLKLIQSQRTWNRNAPESCGLRSIPATAKVVTCLIKRYEQRAHALDECSTGLDLECLNSIDAEGPEANASIQSLP